MANDISDRDLPCFATENIATCQTERLWDQAKDRDPVVGGLDVDQVHLGGIFFIFLLFYIQVEGFLKGS